MSDGGTNATNVFEAIQRDGDDTNFVPAACDSFGPTDAPAGSKEKIDVLRRRLEMGLPLWHSEDRNDYRGLIAAIRPRLEAYIRNA